MLFRIVKKDEYIKDKMYMTEKEKFSFNEAKAKTFENEKEARDKAEEKGKEDQHPDITVRVESTEK